MEAFHQVLQLTGNNSEKNVQTYKALVSQVTPVSLLTTKLILNINAAKVLNKMELILSSHTVLILLSKLSRFQVKKPPITMIAEVLEPTHLL